MYACRSYDDVTPRRAIAFCYIYWRRDRPRREAEPSRHRFRRQTMASTPLTVPTGQQRMRLSLYFDGRSISRVSLRSSDFSRRHISLLAEGRDVGMRDIRCDGSPT